MTIEEVIKLIQDELTCNNKERQRHLARGQWIKAHDCDVSEDKLNQVKKAILDKIAGEGK